MKKRLGNGASILRATTGFRHPGVHIIAPIRDPGRHPILIWSLVLTIGVLFATLSVLTFGWLGGNDTLVRILPDFPAMVPSTALNLAMIACAHGIYLTSSSARMRRLSTYLAALSGVYAAFRLGLQVAWLLIATRATQEAPGDTMAFGTALGLMLASFCTATQDLRDVQIRRISRQLSTIGLLGTLLAIDGMLFDAQALYSIFAFTSMAIHTALCLVALFLAILLAHPEDGWVATLFGAGPGSRLARRMAPVVLLGPAVLCLAGLISNPQTQSDKAFLFVSLTLFVMTCAMVAVLWLGASENRANRNRANKEQQLLTILNGLSTAVFVLDQLGDIRLANEEAAVMTGDKPPERWLYETPFHDLGNHLPLRPSERPVVRLLQEPDLHEVTVGFFGKDRTERILNFTANRTTSMSGEPIWIIAASDETVRWALHDRPPLAGDATAEEVVPSRSRHEISNILGAIRLSADTGLLTEVPDVMQRQFAAILAACDRAVALTTSAESEEQNSGFAPVTQTVTDRPEEPASDLTGVRLLVAEDDPLFGEVLSDSLSMLGADITWVSDGAKALEHARQERPFDLLITDIRLAGEMNGYVLASEFSALSPDVAVIYLSGQASPAPTRAQFKVTPGTFLRKPVGVTDLTNTISLILASERA